MFARIVLIEIRNACPCIGGEANAAAGAFFCSVCVRMQLADSQSSHTQAGAVHRCVLTATSRILKASTVLVIQTVSLSPVQYC